MWVRLKMLEKDDQVIEWFKPKNRPAWISHSAYEALPPSMIVRVIHYTVRRRGFRTKRITLLTTLVDHGQYPKEEIMTLYRRRWEIETNIRCLKETMGMHTLRCQTVTGVQKELIMYAIAYNLVRMEMVKAGRVQRVDPRRISFVDALRSLCARAGEARPRAPADKDPPLPLVVNPMRPGRIEPRAVKRRPKQQRLLTIPRAQARQRLQRQQLAA